MIVHGRGAAPICPNEYFAPRRPKRTMAAAWRRAMQNKRKIAVMIVTNHPIMRDGLRLRVQQEPDMYVVCQTSDVEHTLRDFRLCKPDIALIDLQLPRGAGLLAMNAIRGIAPRTPLVVLTNYPGDVDTSPRTGEGPTLVISKTLVSEQLIAAIRMATGIADRAGPDNTN